MGKFLKVLSIICLSTVLVTGCTGGNSSSSSSSSGSSLGSSSLPSSSAPAPITDEEILVALAGPLENAQRQELPDTDAVAANFGNITDKIQNPILYLGAPNQSTTCLYLVTLQNPNDANEAEAVKTQLNTLLQNWVATQSQGYISGDVNYAVVQKGDRIFGFMHETPEGFAQMEEYINSLAD